jgi:hypothetical protein
MKKGQRLYSAVHFVSVILVTVSFLWITISLPIVFKAEEQNISWSKEPGQSENPFSDTTEEKAPSSSVPVSEEYLHNHNETTNFITDKLIHNHRHEYDIFIAFHGELISPPPDPFLS